MMNKRNNMFFSILKAEHYKVKRNFGVLLILLLPLLITLLVDIYLVYKYAEVKIQYPYNPWMSLMGEYIISFYAFIYPLIIAIFCYSFSDIEYKHNSLKQLFTLPVTQLNIYLAKVFLLIEITLLSVLAAYFLFMLSGYVMSHTLELYSFQFYDSRTVIGAFFFKTFIACLSIAFIQYFLSLLFNNFTIPVGIGSFGVVFSLIALNWKYIDFIPYASIYKSYLTDFAQGATEFMGKVQYINCAYIILFFLLNYFAFSWSAHKGTK